VESDDEENALEVEEDVQMEENAAVSEIQKKLMSKVLPTLER
jgi:hypothetical protein